MKVWAAQHATKEHTHITYPLELKTIFWTTGPLITSIKTSLCDFTVPKNTKTAGFGKCKKISQTRMPLTALLYSQ